MSNDIDGYLVDPSVGRKACAEVESLPYNEIKKEAIRRMIQAGYRGAEFPPGCDMSREGLLDLIAGIAAISAATRIDT